MSNQFTVNPIALFRYSVLGPLVNSGDLPHGQLKALLHQLAQQSYHLPGNEQTTYLSPKTIERWYYQWKQHGIDGLAPKARQDKGYSALSPTLQEQILQTKRDNPTRSVNQIIRCLQKKHLIGDNTVSRAAVYRLLRQHGMSGRAISDSDTIERRSFEAQCANDVWYSDTMHGPVLKTPKGSKKTYLISFMDDVSRLVAHSCFFDNEQAICIEHTLKQALLKRGLPKRLVLDNGGPYLLRFTKF